MLGKVKHKQPQNQQEFPIIIKSDQYVREGQDQDKLNDQDIESL